MNRLSYEGEHPTVLQLERRGFRIYYFKARSTYPIVNLILGFYGMGLH